MSCYALKTYDVSYQQIFLQTWRLAKNGLAAKDRNLVRAVIG